MLKRFFQSRLSSKLLLLMLLNILVLLVLAVFLVTSFDDVRRSSSRIAEAHIGDMRRNSESVFVLSQIFSDIELLSRVFIENDEPLSSESERLKALLLGVESSTLDSRLGASVAAFGIQFERFVNGAEDVNFILDEIQRVDRATHRQLDALEGLISEILISATLREESTHYIDQVLTLVTGYRESLLRIGKLHADHKNHYLTREDGMDGGDGRILTEIDDLSLRLRTLTASEPQISEFGVSLKQLVEHYRDAVLRLEIALMELNGRLQTLQRVKRGILDRIQVLQGESATQAGELSAGIEQLIKSSGWYVVTGVITAILVLSLTTFTLIRNYINKPLGRLVRNIEDIREGHDVQIDLQRDDEWGVIGGALNRMRLDLERYYLQLQASEAKYRTLVENQTDLVVEMERSGRFLFASPAYCQTFGRREAEILGSAELPQVHEMDRAASEKAMQELTGPPYRCHVNQRALTPGGWRWFSWNYRAVVNELGQVTSIVGVGRDVTDRKEAEAALERQRQFLSTVINAVGDPILVIGRDYRIRMSNRAAQIEYGDGKELSLLHLEGLCYKITHGLDQPCSGEKHPCPLHKVIETGEPTQAIHVHTTPRGERVVELMASPFLDAEGRVEGVVQVSRDVTEKLQAEERIRFLAHHDALTELPNRVLLRDRFNQAIHYADRAGHKVALMFLDLDHFKDINDTLGHQVGDQLLKAVVERISSTVRDTDTVSRQGGDEFVILVPQLESSSAPALVSKHILESLGEPLEVEGHKLRISVSIGISVYPDDGSDFDTLLKNADTAMYSSKEAGRNTYRFYSGEMHESAFERLQLHGHLKQALEQEELLLHYQPQVDIASGRVVGVEALLRWQADEFGLLLPDKFIPAAEQSGLIIPIGAWVLGEACRQAREWQDQFGLSIPVAVNLSALQINREGLFESVQSALDRSGIPACRLVLELTESMLLNNSHAVLNLVQQLKQLGVGLAIDDFGTGYSSLSYLKRFQLDRLKIDRSFIRDLLHDSEGGAITRAIIQMAKSLNLTVIAEGVENSQQLDWLQVEGCEQAQGFFYYPPMSAEALLNVLRESRTIESSLH